MSKFKPKTNYQKILEIIDKLSIEEKHYINPNGGIYKDSSYSIYKFVYEKENTPIAFIDCYPYNMTSKTEAFVIVAVVPTYRHQGIIHILLEKASTVLRAMKYKKLIWKCESNNSASKKAAVKNGFKLIKEFGSDCIYERKI